MKITNSIDVVRSAGRFYLNGGVFDADIQDQLSLIYSACRGRTETEKPGIVRRLIAEGRLPYFANNDEFFTTEESAKATMQDLINFFSEFQFLPNFRFVNTLVRQCALGRETALGYISNYFRLIDSPYAEEISNKVASTEFEYIINSLEKIRTDKVVNSRLKIYFGPQGTGKTTAALKETDDLAMVCNASLLPSDLMEDFTFDDGKATFHPSILARCMEEGKPIVLDEINLLPFDSLRFLQGILDGKKEINYKGHTVHINDGFEIIGTMNLVVNGVVFGLPEPLADRCSSIHEYMLTADQLMGAII